MMQYNAMHKFVRVLDKYDYVTQAWKGILRLTAF